MTKRRRRRLTRVAAAYAGVAVAVTAAGLSLWWTYGRSSGGGLPAIAASGRILGVGGRRLRRVGLSVDGRPVPVGRDGRFRTPSLSRPVWLRASAPGWLPFVRPIAPGQRVEVLLARDDGKTAVLNFTGDVMFGRRFFDLNGDGNTADHLVRPNDTVGAHLRLLQQIRPLLANADATVVNLETPLVRNPYYNPNGPRPARFHPTKEFAFASSPAVAGALRRAGVDVVDIGNNHLYDVRDSGVRATLTTLRRAGFTRGRERLGGGRSEGEAWEPALLHVPGARVAIIACTTIDRPPPAPRLGRQLSYVAEGDRKGGAAACDEHRIVTTTRTLRERGDVVVVMVHGGFEYHRAPSPHVRALTNAARAAGAALVVDGHPHVIGGLDWNGRALAAWTMGNFVFDQTVWPTFEGYILRVEIRDGRVTRAFAFPLMIDGHRPRAVTGQTAAYVEREAAGRSRGDFFAHDGLLELDPGAPPTHRSHTFRLRPSEPGAVYRLENETVAARAPGIELGRDLLWVGGFEDEDVDEAAGEAPLWLLNGTAEHVGPSFARRGNAGLRLIRSDARCSDVYVSPAHRILLAPRTRLSVVGAVRTHGDGVAGVQLSWYGGTQGGSRARQYFRIAPAAPDRWRTFRFEVRAPRWAKAMTPYLRLTPAEHGEATADWDDLAVVAWERPRPALADYLRVRRPTNVRLTESAPQGTQPDAPSAPALVATVPHAKAERPSLPARCARAPSVTTAQPPAQ